MRPISEDITDEEYRELAHRDIWEMVHSLSDEEELLAKQMPDYEAVGWLTLMASEEIDFEHIEAQSRTEATLKPYNTGTSRLQQRVRIAKEQYGG